MDFEADMMNPVDVAVDRPAAKRRLKAGAVKD